MMLGRDQRLVRLLCVFGPMPWSRSEADVRVSKLSIASCGDSQLTWESKKSSFTQVGQLQICLERTLIAAFSTQWLIELLSALLLLPHIHSSY